MSSSPFASGVTSADIQALQKRFDDLEKLIKDKFNTIPVTTTVPSTSTIPSVTGLSGILPPSSQIDISDIFPKGGRRKYSRKKTKRSKKRSIY